MTNGFDLTKLKATGITFESVVPSTLPNGRQIPQIKVGFRGKFIGVLYQYTRDTPHPTETILPGQWFAVLQSGNSALDLVVNSSKPAGRELNDLKRSVEYFVKKHLK